MAPCGGGKKLPKRCLARAHGCGKRLDRKISTACDVDVSRLADISFWGESMPIKRRMRGLMAEQARIPDELRSWIEARQRFHLSHAHVQMAFELGLNPKQFGKLANHRQEPWKRPLPDFIAHLYAKRFGKAAPDNVRTIEQIAAARAAKKLASKQARMARKAAAAPSLEPSSDAAPVESRGRLGHDRPTADTD
jgi:hypothetical protein